MHVFHPYWCETCRVIQQQFWMKKCDIHYVKHIWPLLHIFRGSGLPTTVIYAPDYDALAVRLTQGVREEAKKTSKYYIAQLIKVDKQTVKNRARRDERMAAAVREEAKNRIEFLKERERHVLTEIGSHVSNDVANLEVAQ